MFKNPSISVEGFFCFVYWDYWWYFLCSRFISRKDLGKTKVLSSKSLYFVI